jgi:hypothetical protein
MDASRNSTSGNATNTNGSESSPRLSSARIANDSSLDTASLLSREDSDPEKGLPHERPGLEGLGLGSSGDRESSRSPAYGVLTSGVINEGPVEFKLCVSCLADKSLASCHCSVIFSRITCMLYLLYFLISFGCIALRPVHGVA